jgi:hypothetical protein
MFSINKKNRNYKVLADGFVYLLVTHKAAEVFHSGLFELYALHNDGSESLIETYAGLEEAMEMGEDIGIEVGNTREDSTLIVAYTKDLSDGSREDFYHAIRPEEEHQVMKAEIMYTTAIEHGCYSASICSVIKSTDY